MLPSGGGKSTLALRALRDEGTLLSEDSPLLDRRGRLHPFPLRIGINATTPTAFRPRACAGSSGWSSTRSSRSSCRPSRIGSRPLRVPAPPRDRPPDARSRARLEPGPTARGRDPVARGRRRCRHLPGDGVHPPARNEGRDRQARRRHEPDRVLRGRALAGASLAGDHGARPGATGPRSRPCSGGSRPPASSGATNSAIRSAVRSVENSRRHARQRSSRSIAARSRRSGRARPSSRSRTRSRTTRFAPRPRGNGGSTRRVSRRAATAHGLGRQTHRECCRLVVVSCPSSWNTPIRS